MLKEIVVWSKPESQITRNCTTNSDGNQVCTYVRAADDTYNRGETIRLGAVFHSGHVGVSGQPIIRFRIDSKLVRAIYVGQNTWRGSDGTERTVLYFEYVVLPGERDTDGILVPANSVKTTHVDRIYSSWDGSLATLTFAGLAAQAEHKVDGNTGSGHSRSEPEKSSGTGQPEPEQQSVAPLEASIESAPSEHRGKGQFAILTAFSGPVAARPQDAAIEVTGGTLKRARRVDGRADRWRLYVAPHSHGAVTVTLPATTDCAAPGAICTADGRRLETALTHTVQGPPGLSVADASAQEGAGATLDFAVTLSRAASDEVKVRYATADGTAKKGADYRGRKGMLTFAAGETAKTVSVPVLDDAHDEGDGDA